MTYEERQKAICKECTDYNTSKCPYVIRSLRCPNLSNQMDGWELGWQDAIDKVCELLNRMVCEITYKDPHENSSAKHYDKDEFIQDFKKAIEEQ